MGLKRTKAPAEVAKFLDFLATDANYAEMMAKTENIPAHLGVAKAGVTLQRVTVGEGCAEHVRGRCWQGGGAELRFAGLSPESRGVPADGGVWVKPSLARSPLMMRSSAWRRI